MNQDRILRLPEVLEIAGIKRTTLHYWIRRNEFPQPVRLGSRHIGWRDSEIQAWIASREHVTYQNQADAAA